MNMLKVCDVFVSPDARQTTDIGDVYALDHPVLLTTIIDQDVASRKLKCVSFSFHIESRSSFHFIPFLSSFAYVSIMRFLSIL